MQNLNKTNKNKICFFAGRKKCDQPVTETGWQNANLKKKHKKQPIVGGYFQFANSTQLLPIANLFSVGNMIVNNGGRKPVQIWGEPVDSTAKDPCRVSGAAQ